MGKKKYIKPDIREESQILTVSAWVTKTTFQLASPVTTTNVSLQEAAEELTNTSVARFDRVTSTTYFSQILWRYFN